MSVDIEKAALRALLATRRQAAFTADPDAGLGLAAMFPDALTPAPGCVVSGFLRFRSEIDPAPLMARLAAAGCVLALPRTPGKSDAAGLVFHRWRLGDPLVRSAFGVMEPLQEADVLAPDLVLAPLLGFDRAGRRLGYGRGHYDRAVAALRAHKSVTVVGLAYAAQEVPVIVTDATDQRLDWIVTPTLALKVAGS